MSDDTAMARASVVITSAPSTGTHMELRGPYVLP